MGVYLNQRSNGFQACRNDTVFVDKSLLIDELNKIICGERCFLCVARPRRFGKSSNIKMLSAYYNCEEDNHALFDDLKIAKTADYEKHLNKYEVIWIDVQSFWSRGREVSKMKELIETDLLYDLRTRFPEVAADGADLTTMLRRIFASTGKQFIFLVDEWDCIFREAKKEKAQQEEYLDYLRLLFKGQNYIALVYMTGILPIKKYGTHSALNMFTESTLTSPFYYAEYFGFTEEEVRGLCTRFNRSFEETKAWYDGYELERFKDDTMEVISLYNPMAVSNAMTYKFQNYWNKTEFYFALQHYILLNYAGLKEDVVRMIAGEEVRVDTESFVNDFDTFASKDDVLTLLIHLGYLTYNSEQSTVRIPNKEIRDEFRTSIKNSNGGFPVVAEAVQNSFDLLEAIWAGDAERMASAIEDVHNGVSIFKYNDENSLSCVLKLAMFAASEYYNEFREMATGKGFADIVYLPRPLHADKPAMVVELKCDATAQTAIKQIRERGYLSSLGGYKGEVVLVGVSYDRQTKRHSCVIERILQQE